MSGGPFAFIVLHQSSGERLRLFLPVSSSEVELLTRAFNNRVPRRPKVSIREVETIQSESLEMICDRLRKYF